MPLPNGYMDHVSRIERESNTDRSLEDFARRMEHINQLQQQIRNAIGVTATPTPDNQYMHIQLDAANDPESLHIRTTPYDSDAIGEWQANNADLNRRIQEEASRAHEAMIWGRPVQTVNRIEQPDGTIIEHRYFPDGRQERRVIDNRIQYGTPGPLNDDPRMPRGIPPPNGTRTARREPDPTLRRDPNAGIYHAGGRITWDADEAPVGGGFQAQYRMDDTDGIWNFTRMDTMPFMDLRESDYPKGLNVRKLRSGSKPPVNFQKSITYPKIIVNDDGTHTLSVVMSWVNDRKYNVYDVHQMWELFEITYQRQFSSEPTTTIKDKFYETYI